MKTPAIKFKKLLIALFCFAGLGLGSCDKFEEDVIPETFADIRIHPDEIYLYSNGKIALQHFINDTLSSYENITYTAPRHGKLTTIFDTTERLAYEPDANFVGTDSLTYQVCVGQTCKTAKIKLVVEKLPDINNCTSILRADSVETTVNTPKEIRFFSNDLLCPNDSRVQWWMPEKGTAYIYSYQGTGTVSFKNTVYVYYPPKNYRGTDTFYYRVYPPNTYPNGNYHQMVVKIKIK